MVNGGCRGGLALTTVGPGEGASGFVVPEGPPVFACLQPHSTVPCPASLEGLVQSSPHLTIRPGKFLMPD